jgi:hypothetical protein
MSLPDPRGRFGATLLISLTLGLLAIQMVTNEPPFGSLGLILLVMPGFAISQALGPRPFGWPEVLLTTLGAAIVLAVLSGVIAALLPRGLTASSVAAVEIVAMSAASTTWLVRLAGGSDRTWVRSRITVRPKSLLLVVAGLALSIAGFMVAVRGEEQDAQTSFVQLWSVSPTSGVAQTFGLRNATGVAIDCEAAILRPGEPAYDSPIGTVANGQSWLGQLPERDGSRAGLWQINVHCTGPDGTVFDRRLNINPPA